MYKILFFSITLVLFNTNLCSENLYKFSYINEYTNLLNFQSKDINADINYNHRKYSFLWERELFYTEISYVLDDSKINITGIDTALFQPLEVNNEKIIGNEKFYYPEFKMGFAGNSIFIKLQDEIEYDIKFLVPFGQQFSLGMNHKTTFPFNRSLDLFGTYKLNFNPKITTTSLLTNIKLKWFEAGVRTSAITISNIPSLLAKDNISIYLNNKSDFFYGGYIGLNRNDIQIKLTGDIVLFENTNSPVYLYKSESLLGSSSPESGLYYWDLKLNCKIKNLNVTLSHKKLFTNPLDLFITTAPLIYGPFASRRYDISIPGLDLKQTGINIGYSYLTLWGDISLKVNYNRIYGLMDSLNYSYKEYIWAVFYSKLIGYSSLLTIPIEYDHINLLDLSIKSNIELTNYLFLSLKVDQLIPFYDSTVGSIINYWKDYNSGNKTSLVDNNSITGGTTISLGIILKLKN